MRTRIVHFLIGCGMALGLVLAPLAVSAAGNYGLSQTAKQAGYGAGDTVESTVDRVVFTLLSLLAIIFFLLVTYAGLRWMTAQGNEETVAEAKNTLEAAVIGLIVVTAAYAITSFIFRTIDSGGNAPVTPVAPVTSDGGNDNGGAPTDESLSCEEALTEAVCSAISTLCAWNAATSRCTTTASPECEQGSDAGGTYYCADTARCDRSNNRKTAPSRYQTCTGGQVCCANIVYGETCKTGSNTGGANWCTAASSCGNFTTIPAGSSYQDCESGDVCCSHNINTCGGFPNTRCVPSGTSCAVEVGSVCDGNQKCCVVQ